MAKSGGKRPAGRPRIEIDFTLLDNLCYVQCTEEEIASVLGVSVDTLARRVQEETGKGFAEYFAEKRAGGRMSLRRRQFTTAMGRDPIVVDGELISEGNKPNPTMLIWLGKQYLGQSDKNELTGRGGGALRVNYEVVDGDGDT